MSHPDRRSPMHVAPAPDLFATGAQTGRAHMSAEHVAAYVSALEARCNTLWGYIQGYNCECDPVLRFLAAELGITIAYAADAEAGPAAD